MPSPPKPASRPAAWVSPYCGSAASNRRLLGPAPARSAAREAREPPLRARARSRPGLRPLPSALGQRLPKELRVRERSGKWRLLSHPGAGEAGRRGRGGSGKGGEEAELVRSPSRGSRTSGGRASRI
nr:histone-lysine N-methyltransferase 2B-like isoform X1 [Macaca nemestrina]